jgi:hypothetical protein
VKKTYIVGKKNLEETSDEVVDPPTTDFILTLKNSKGKIKDVRLELNERGMGYSLYCGGTLGVGGSTLAPTAKCQMP